MSPQGAAQGRRWDPRSLLFWAGLPLVAIQGIRVRRRAPRFAPAAGADRGEVGTGPILRLLALGDSIVAGVGVDRLERALPGALARELAARQGRRVRWRAIGRNGADAEAVHRAFRGLRDELEPADLVLLSLGVNDVTGLRPRSRFRRDLQALCADLRDWSPQALLLHVGIPPLQCFPLLPPPLRHWLGLRAAQLDAVAAAVLAVWPPSRHLPIARTPAPEAFAADGFHPGAAACADWAGELVARLTEGPAQA